MSNGQLPESLRMSPGDKNSGLDPGCFKQFKTSVVEPGMTGRPRMSPGIPGWATESLRTTYGTCRSPPDHHSGAFRIRLGFYMCSLQELCTNSLIRQTPDRSASEARKHITRESPDNGLRHILLGPWGTRGILMYKVFPRNLYSTECHTIWIHHTLPQDPKKWKNKMYALYFNSKSLDQII